MNVRFGRVSMLLIVGLLLLAACSPTPVETPEPTSPTAAATVQPAAPTPPQATLQPVVPTPTGLAPVSAAGDDLARAKAEGVLLVGSSLDNPPYSTYNEQYRPTGFDVAYITEIGRRLGLRADINDFTFEGLLDVLKLKQVDAAIAAIDITPERASQVDFSTPYYMGEDGILAAPNSLISSVKSLADLQARRIGVQRGSVYESWLLNTLVQTGKTPRGNLLSYVSPDQAVDDLDAGRVDLVIMDKKPAENFARQGKAKLVGNGLNPQAFAIAVRKGSPLRAEIDRIIFEMVKDGTSAHLIETYLHVPASVVAQATPAAAQATPAPATPMPAPTAAATAAAPPTAAPCIDGMAWVADLTLDDKSMTAPAILQPGQPFSKSWRLRNAGTCEWTPDFSLTYRAGNVPEARMGGNNFKIGKAVPPGQTIDLTTNLVAPKTPGVHQGFWQMANAAGKPFGERVWVGIRVPAPAAVAPAPTQTPAPGISFGVDRTTINAGECVNFNWNVSGVKAVYFHPQGQPYQTFGVAGQGGKQMCPTGTTIYELRVERNDGSTETRQIQINVNAVAGAPVIAEFRSTPEYEVNAGQCANFQWRIDGAVSRVALVRDGAPIWDYAPVTGSYNDCPPNSGQKSYELQAWGPGGFVKSQRGLMVRPSVTPPTAVPPTAAPQPPAQPMINSFTANPAQLSAANNCTMLQWQVTGQGLAAVWLSRNGERIAGPDVQSGYKDCVAVKDAGKTQVYDLKVDTESGGSATRQLEVPFPKAQG